MTKLFEQLGISSALILDGHESSVAIAGAVKSVPRTKYVSPLGANVYDLVWHRHLVVTEAGVRDITEKALTTNRARGE